jgi:peptidoglycan/LPS O-acetylase OafA/YrhL
MGLGASQQRFHTMDGLRGVAAICVMLYHFTQTRAGSWLPSGNVAVDIFFCLSGFVIANSYGAKLDAGLGASDFAAFRLIRLYPLYFVGLLLGLTQYALASLAGGADASWSMLALAIANALFVLPTLYPFPMGQGAEFTDRVLFPFNGPSWSLSLELFCNGLFVVFRPRGAALAATIGALGIALVVSTMVAGQPCGWGRHIFWGGFPRAMYSFYVGVALREIWAAGRMPRFGWPLAPLAMVVFLSVAPESIGLFLFVALLGGPLIVCATISNPRSPWLIKLFAALGDASYPIYALHLPAFGLLKLGFAYAAGTPWDQPPPLAMDLLFAALVFVACLGVARKFDGPLRRRLMFWRFSRGVRLVSEDVIRV